MVVIVTRDGPSSSLVGTRSSYKSPVFSSMSENSEVAVCEESSWDDEELAPIELSDSLSETVDKSEAGKITLHIELSAKRTRRRLHEICSAKHSG